MQVMCSSVESLPRFSFTGAAYIKVSDPLHFCRFLLPSRSSLDINTIDLLRPLYISCSAVMLLATYTALLLSLEIYTLAAPIRNGQLPPSFSVEAVLPTSFADPCIIQESSGTWWAFASNGTGANVPVALSQDFAHWQEYSQQHSHFDALPHPGAWAAPVPLVWAPDVAQMVRNANCHKGAFDTIV